MSRLGKRATLFLNRQFALIVLAFFVLSLNAVAAPVSLGDSRLNPLIQYNPIALAEASNAVNPYVPILQQLSPKEVEDQVISSVVGSETTYTPKPLLPETISHDVANRQLRGLRGEYIAHTVQQGETLSKIAAQYGLNVATLLNDNNIDVKDLSKIKPGTKLTIAPEKSTDSTEWLDKLHEEERKAREQKQKEQQSRLAKANQSKGISRAKAADTDAGSGGKFRRPIGGTCYNGYHWWAIDCPHSPGSGIAAAAGGRVIRADGAGYNGGYGKMVEIDHGNGWVTLYAHMSALGVSNGEVIAAGDIIGQVGSTGHSTGPHVHFEVQKNGQRLNPCGYVGC